MDKVVVVGVNYHGKNEAGEIPQLWNVLMEREDELKIGIWTRCARMECTLWDRLEASHDLTILPATRVFIPEKMPEGMAGLRLLPASMLSLRARTWQTWRKLRCALQPLAA